MELLLDRTILVLSRGVPSFFCHAKAKLPRKHWTSTFCRRKLSASYSSHHSSTWQVSWVLTQELIDSGLGKLENKPRGVARNTWSWFPVSVINSFACETDEIDICAFPFWEDSSAFGRFENIDSSSKSFADDFILKKCKMVSVFT